MTRYPEKTCTIDRLVRSKFLVKAALEGNKTQQRRDGIYGYPNEEFQLDGKRFHITDLTRESLGEMTEKDAQAEGFPDLKSYKELILRMHKNMQWNPESLVWVHTFKKAN